MTRAFALTALALWLAAFTSLAVDVQFDTMEHGYEKSQVTKLSDLTVHALKDSGVVYQRQTVPVVLYHTERERLIAIDGVFNAGRSQ